MKKYILTLFIVSAFILFPYEVSAQTAIRYYIYSDQLQNSYYNASFSNGDNPTNPDNTNPVYSGTKSLAFSGINANSVFRLGTDTPTNLSPYTHLTFAAQASQSGGTYFIEVLNASWGEIKRVSLANYGGQPPVGSWKIYSIPLADLGAAYTTSAGIAFAHDSFWNTTHPTIYIDEVGYTGSAPTPTITPTPFLVTPPVTPAPNQTIRSYVYQDALGTGWGEWLWDTLSVNYSNSPLVYNGYYSMAITPERGWTAWAAWNDTPVDTSQYSLFTFAARGNTAGTWWEVQFLNSGGNSISSNNYKFQPSLNEWQVHTINLSEYGVSYQQVYAVRLWYVSDIQTSTLYIDDMGFGGPIPPSPTPAPPQTRQVSVNASQPINPFNSEMLGYGHANWEHAWGKPFPGAVTGLAQIYQAAHIGLIRYAGGLWANSVGWDRVPQRTPYTEWQKNGHTYWFHYGTDEIDSLATLSAQSGANVMIQVNLSSNDPAMWADMVKYTNIEHNYHFKYWELGNEIDLECNKGEGTCIDAATYQTRAAAYKAAMKAVDPTIIIVGGVSSTAHDIVANGWSDTPNLSRYLTSGKNAGADSLSYHWYTDCNASSYDNIFTYSWSDDRTVWQNNYSRSWGNIAPSRVQTELINPSGKPLTQGITELNTDACDFNRAPQNSNQIAALWYADVLGRLAYNGLDYVTWYEGYGAQAQGYPAVASTTDYPATLNDLYLRPTYYVAYLYGNYFGDNLVSTTDPDPNTISVWASTDTKDPGTLKLMVTNLYAAATTVTLNVDGFVINGGNKYEVTNPNPLNRSEIANGPNHGTTINGFTLTPSNITTAQASIPAKPVTVTSNTVTTTLPAYSVTAIVLKSGTSPPPLSSDFDHDGDVDFIDLKLLLLRPFNLFDLNRLIQSL